MTLIKKNNLIPQHQPIILSANKIKREESSCAVKDEFASHKKNHNDINTLSPTCAAALKAENKNNSAAVETPVASQKTISKRLYSPSLKGRLKHFLQKMMAVAVIAGSVTAGPGVASAGAAGTDLSNSSLADNQQDDLFKKPAIEMVLDKNETGFYHNMEDIFDQIKNAKYETQVGDYKLKVDYVTPRIGVRPRVNPKIEDGKLDFKWSGNVRTQIDVLNTEMSRTQQNGSWTETQGVRGKIQGEWLYGAQGDTLREFRETNEHKLSVQASAFKRWDRELEGGRHLRLDAVAGGSHEFVNDSTKFHISFQQELKGDNLNVMGQNMGWILRASENVTYNVQDNEFDASYKLFAGVTKRIPMRIFRQDCELRVEAGPGIRGDLDNPIAFRPEAKVRVKF